MRMYEARHSYQFCVHFRDSFSGLLRSGELHKADTTADASVGVTQHLTRHDGAKLLQQPYNVWATLEHLQVTVNREHSKSESLCISNHEQDVEVRVAGG